ncbi:hypothetical protein [Kineobactrum salinum]|uniref:Uncharacterized protein n=1 Tax=Kineobactrum salinum TaxID=2708301 RepID=A0A6C0TZB8_9GAMM|nr:hypothetical protein [Kineobactrum salinum]QIB64047.1 hypothetical protein G3T16_17730 [Kineobactrum salinum]
MMDWNWFFGALAQSAAAIVGIFGAFIITKILTNQSAYSQKSNRAKELLAESRRIVDSANDLSIEWYLERRIADEVGDLNEILERDDSQAPEVYYDQLHFPYLLERKRALEIIANAKELRRRRIAHKEEKKRREAEERSKVGPFHQSLHLQPFPHVPDPMARITSAHVQNQTEREREAIDTVVRDARHQIRVVNDFLDSIRGNPESSPQITHTLLLVTVLFFAGVVYPLSFLPATPNGMIELSLSAFWPLLFSLKGALLAVVAAVFTAVLLMFFWLNISLRYSEELIEDLSQFTDLRRYSAYFEVMETNERAGAAAHNGQKIAAGDV